MPNLAPTRPAQKCNFSHRKWWEVIVKHEAFLGFALETFEALHVVAGTEGGGNEGLRFAAGEDGAAVGAGQDAGFNPNVADLVEGAAVRTPLVVDDLVAEKALAQSFVILLELGFRFVIVFRKSGDQLFLQSADKIVAFKLRMLLGIESVG